MIDQNHLVLLAMLLQVLGNLETRTTYDQELATHAQHATAISDEVDLQEMNEAQGPHGKEYVVACRCGGAFVVSALDVRCANVDVVLPCTHCSLHILVHVAHI